MRQEIGVDGPCAADEVWDRYLRPRRWPQWAPQIRSVDCADERLTAGTRGVVRGPACLTVPFEVTAVDPDGPVRSWSWRVRAAGLTLRLTHTITSLPDGTHAGLSIDGPAPVVLAYLPVARVALHRLTR